MNESDKDDIELVLDWNDLGETTGLRRNTAGFGEIKSLAKQATGKRPLVINAFLYAFLCPAKNFDLFLQENVDAISNKIAGIEQKMESLTEFERTGSGPLDSDLRNTYLAVRNIAARKNARDEQRTLATLLFSGPSTVNEIAEDLGMSENLAERILRVLAPVTEEPSPGLFRLRSDTETLAIVLQLLRSTLGIDPLRVLRRRIEARKSEAAA